MKTVIFVHLFNDRSGSPKIMSQVVRAMAKRGTGCEVITSGHPDGFLSDIPVVRRKIFYRRSEIKLATLFYYLISQALLFTYCLRYWRQDVVFYVNTMMPFGAALAARWMRKSVIYHIHETSLSPPALKRFLRLIIQLTATKIIFVSEYLKKVEDFPNKRQYVVHNAINGELKRPHKRGIGANFNVLMLCSLKDYKGVPEFFSIARTLYIKGEINFTLVLNAEQTDIDALLAGVTIPSNVKLFSRQTNVDLFYEQADLLVNLSRPDQWVETFGLTILEGMAHGLPVVVPPIGGPAEIVRDGMEGFLIPCYETQRISDVIWQLSTDHELYSRLARNAHARAQDFGLPNFEEKIAYIIES